MTNIEYNFEVIPNQQTPKVEMIGDVNMFIEVNSDLLNAYLEYATNSHRAVGLAANQNSLNGERFMVRLFALRNANNVWRLIINPRITKHIGIVDTKIEGCLTWKDMLIIAERSRAVEVSYYDIDGNFHESEIYKGFEGQIWQHEINHLDGIEENVQDRSYPIPKPIDVQRNEKCPCGSGRKYKQCCLLLL